MTLSQERAIREKPAEALIVIESLKSDIDKANDLINELYESGCLDSEREDLIKKYLATRG